MFCLVTLEPFFFTQELFMNDTEEAACENICNFSKSTIWHSKTMNPGEQINSFLFIRIHASWWPFPCLREGTPQDQVWGVSVVTMCHVRDAPPWVARKGVPAAAWSAPSTLSNMDSDDENVEEAVEGTQHVFFFKVISKKHDMKCRPFTLRLSCFDSMMLVLRKSPRVGVSVSGPAW